MHHLVNTVDMGERYEYLSIGSKTIKFHLDTRVKVNVVSPKVIQDLDIECHFKKSQAKLIRVMRLVPKSSVTLPCEYKSKVFHVKFHEVDVEAREVLSAQPCKDMNLLARINSLQQHSSPKSPTVMGPGIFDYFKVCDAFLESTQSS